MGNFQMKNEHALPQADVKRSKKPTSAPQGLAAVSESRKQASVSEKSRQIGMDRLVFFSDAVMAIAITLLAIDLRLPDVQGGTPGQLGEILASMAPQFIAFIISFLVIGMFWGAHHRIFLYIRHYDRALLWLNLLFLLLVVFMPFPTSVLAQFGGTAAGVIFYAAVVAAISLMRAWIWHHAAYHHRLVDEQLPESLIRFETMVGLVTAGVFILSIGLGLINPLLAEITWVLTAILWFVIRGDLQFERG
jgi:uncharacterized membrane protein